MSSQDNIENRPGFMEVRSQKSSAKSESKPRRIVEVDTSTLNPHPRNAGIYGSENVSDLVALIKERGHIVNSLVVNQDNTIISGHRRWMAAKELGYPTVPCEVIAFDSEDDELEALVHYNASREKTFEARVRESMALEAVYSAKAEKRKLGNLKQNNTEMDNLTTSEESVENEDIKGATRDVVAKKAGISSGKTYDRGRKVVEEIDRQRENGNTENVELLIYLLNNKSVSTTAILVDEAILESLSQEKKQELRNGKISVRSIVPKSKNDDSKKKAKTHYVTVKNNIKTMVSAAKELTNTGIAGNTDKQNQKIREDIQVIIRNLQDLLGDDTVNIQ